MKRFSLLASLLVLIGVIVPQIVHADTSNFIVTDFTADYYLSKSDPQGALKIDEHLTVNFNDDNHGILRALPQKYNGQQQHLKIIKVQRDGAAEPYSTYTSNGNKVLKIGSAAKTITGVHTYDVDYSVQNVMRFTANHDELDWNTNGTEWTQPFESITARLHVPSGLAHKLSGTSCFTGVQGSTAQDCTVDSENNRATNETTFTTTRALTPGETMTFVADFPLGTFNPPTAVDWWRDNGAKVAEVALPTLLAFAVAYRKWYRDGKDIKGRGTIIPEYGPPEGMRPAEADVINQYKLGKNAISATIIDLAIRKYLKIVEGQSDGLLGLGKHKTYSLQRLPAPAGGSPKPYEQQIYDGLFPAGDIAEMSDLKNKFYKTSAAVQKAIPAALTAEGYFPKNPTRAGNWMHGAGIALVAGAWFAHSFVSIGLVAGGLIFLFFGSLMSRRTQKGVDAKDTLAGLKMYMEVAEKDRLAMLQSVDAPYAETSAEPTKTVDLFEKLLPYAMIMGVEKSWAKQFEGIYTTPPDWYAGNWASFNTGYLVSSLSESVGAMNASFAAPSSSGSGAGGGFAGGGGGGGGGGGW
jgi:hypothetical protein